MKRSMLPFKGAALAFLAPSILAVVLGGALPAFAQSTNATNHLDFQSFRLIVDRNIFNPHRYARMGTARQERPRQRTESFTLVGTMSYEKGTLAFFDSTRSDYRKVVKSADTIAGYTVTAISPGNVKLTAGTNEVEVPVGMQLRREEQGAWELAAAPESGQTSGRSPAAFGPGAAPGLMVSTPDTGGNGTNGGAQVIILDGTAQPVITDSLESGGTNAAPETPPGGEDPVLARLRARAAAERGDR